MLSTLLELAGFAAFAVATFLVAGLADSLFVAGAELLFVGYAVDDEKVAMSVSRALAPARRRLAAVRVSLRLHRVTKAA